MSFEPVIVYLGLGSNMGNRQENLNRARQGDMRHLAMTSNHDVTWFSGVIQTTKKTSDYRRGLCHRRCYPSLTKRSTNRHAVPAQIRTAAPMETFPISSAESARLARSFPDIKPIKIVPSHLFESNPQPSVHWVNMIGVKI